MNLMGRRRTIPNPMMWKVDRFGMSIFVARMMARVADGTGLHSARISRLIAATSTHRACVAKLRERTASASEAEKKARWQIIAYKPRNQQEALERLSYLFAMIATANNWLEDDEVKELATIVRIYSPPNSYFVKLNQCLEADSSVSSLMSK